MTIDPGTELSCTNPDCGCLLRVERPCPHGDGYMCACGHPFATVSSTPQELLDEELAAEERDVLLGEVETD